MQSNQSVNCVNGKSISRFFTHRAQSNLSVDCTNRKSIYASHGA